MSDEIEELTERQLGYSRPGGLEICFDEHEIKVRKDKLSRLKSHQPNFSFEVLRRNSVCDIISDVGDDVVGAIYSPADGHVNPLYLLQGLQAAFKAKGGKIINGESISEITKDETRYKLKTKISSHFAEQIVLAAGLGNRKLGASLGLDIPVKPLRGQIAVTERIKKFFPYAATQIRQTEEGSIMIGVSHEDVGLDDGTDPKIMNKISKSAIRAFPLLAKTQVVRVWGALRVMTPDGYPIYEESTICPGVFAVACHSGVTLAAAHAYDLAASLYHKRLPKILFSMTSNRFKHAVS